jgi:hypothetical protein
LVTANTQRYRVYGGRYKVEGVGWKAKRIRKWEFGSGKKKAKKELSWK